MIFCPGGIELIEREIPIVVGIGGLETGFQGFDAVGVFDLADELIFREFAVVIRVFGLENLLDIRLLLRRSQPFVMFSLGIGRPYADTQCQTQNRKGFPHKLSLKRKIYQRLLPFFGWYYIY